MTTKDKNNLKETLYKVADMQFESIVNAMSHLESMFPGHTAEEYALICDNTLAVVQKTLIESASQSAKLFSEKIKDIKQEDFDV